MLGRNHSTIGAVAFLAVAPTITSDPTATVLAAACAAGAAVLADLDHPKATVSRVIPIVGPLCARGVAFLAGGHRNRTHTIEAAAIATGAAWTASADRVVAAGSIVLLVCFAAALLGPHLRLVSAASRIEFVVGAAAGGAVLRFDWVPINWLPSAVGIGYAVHLLTDAVTVSGIRPILLAPKVQLHLGWIRTGGVAEHAVGTIAVLALGLLVYMRIAQPILESTSL